MSWHSEALRFGIYLAVVGIGVTFGSLILLYFILLAFSKYQRFSLGEKEEAIQTSEPLPAEIVAAVVVGIENYLDEERAYISQKWQLEFRKPSAWKISGRSEE